MVQFVRCIHCGRLCTFEIDAGMPQIGTTLTRDHIFPRNLRKQIIAMDVVEPKDKPRAHSGLHVTPFNRMLQTGGAYLIWNDATSAGLAALNAEITRQASIVAYVDDFKFMLLISLPTALLLLLMRRPNTAPQADAAAVLD